MGWYYTGAAGTQDPRITLSRETVLPTGGFVYPFLHPKEDKDLVPVCASAEEGGMVLLTAGSGWSGTYSGPVTAKEDGQVNINAIANPGYVFTGWDGRPNYKEKTLTLYLSRGETTACAKFEEKKEYTLDLEIEGCGTVEVTPAKKYYAEGERVSS